jgi:RND family efflux transporter MFP subunit
MSFRSTTKLCASTAMLLFLTACDQSTTPVGEVPPRPVMAMKVADVSALAERSFPGRAAAEQEVNLSFRVSGPLIELPVKVGDRVEKGAELARIDPRDFEVKIATIQGKLEQARATLSVAEREYDRAAGVAEKGGGLISESELDKRLGARDAARANVRSLESALLSAENDLEYTWLTAPYSGTVVATFVENYEDVLAKTPILRLLDPTRIKMVISVPESLIGLEPYVESATVTFDALPGVQIPAEIVEIGREASQVTRTYPVTLVMQQPEDGEILPGMAGRATITSRPPEASTLVGIQIPATALLAGAESGSGSVWIVDEDAGALSRRDVEIGQLGRFGVLVNSGIEPGEWLVVKGVHSVRDGQPVRIIDVAAEETTP